MGLKNLQTVVIDLLVEELNFISTVVYDKNNLCKKKYVTDSNSEWDDVF